MAKHIASTAVFSLLAVWSAACLWFDGPESRGLAGLLAGGLLLASLALAIFVRPLRRQWIVFAILIGCVQFWWLGIEARNDREWLRDVAETPTVSFDGDLVTVRNVRDFDYRSDGDFDEVWETRSYDLSELRGVDLFLSYWGSDLIAHTIMSWEFADGQHLAISIETRKEVGEEYSAILGFFRQYELYYVAADERDLIGIRAAHRDEEVYLYRLTTPIPTARAILVDYLEEMNRLASEPRWYNALTHNCTTTIRKHAKHVAPGNPFSWKILVNGFIDELGYDRGTIDTSVPFEELKRRSDITQAARAAIDSPDFSSRIRHGLPGEDWRYGVLENEPASAAENSALASPPPR